MNFFFSYAETCAEKCCGAQKSFRYAALLDALCCAGEKVRKSVLSKAKRELVLVLVDCARLLIRNKTEPQLRHL